MSLDQTDDAIDPVDAAGSERTPLTKSRPEVVRESPNNVFSPLSVASEATAPGDNSVDSSFSSENVGGSVTPSPIVRRDADVAAGAEDDVEVGVSMSFASTGDGDDDDDDDSSRLASPPTRLRRGRARPLRERVPAHLSRAQRG
jgi:hypothetical protein